MKTFCWNSKEIDSEMWKYILRFQGKSEIMARLAWLDGSTQLPVPPATDNLWGSQTIFDGKSRLGASSPSNLLVLSKTFLFGFSMLDRIRVIENQWPYHATKCKLDATKKPKNCGTRDGEMHLVSSDVWDIIRRTRQACYRKTFRRHNNTFMRVRTHFYWYTLFYWYTHFRFYLRFSQRWQEECI